FAWASWLGEQMNWVLVNASTLPERLEQAAQLACSSAAKALPGYPGEQCSTMRHLINTAN
ncbi:chromosome partitioning protein ParB, partial [Vibrio anguillarum]|nr:chromosome partitioning protein ParB [Vibrio anguillarum]